MERTNASAISSNIQVWVKFLLMSATGLFSFFVTFTIDGEKTFLVNHVANAVKGLLTPYVYHYILVLAGIGMVDLCVRRHKFLKDLVNVLLSLSKVMGFLIIASVVFGFGPAFLLKESVGPFILKKLLFPISITIPVAALFLPFLLDFGLTDFCGVLMRPIMRPLFKAPGRSAVIAVSAFLGNFSIGHIAVDSLYKDGKLTAKEAAIIATSFCTASVAFLMVLASLLNIMEYWNFYFWSSFLVTMTVTFVSVRIWPLSRKPETYHPGVTPRPEKVFHSDLLKNAFQEGLQVAAASDSLARRLAFIMKESMLIVMGFMNGVMFFAAVGILVNEYTSFFQYLGYVFYPFLKLVQIPDIGVAMKAAGISFLDILLPAVFGSQSDLALQTRYLIGTISVSAVVFLAAFIPCILSTDIPVKFSELVLLWLQRTILTILFAGTLALFYF
jgi:nucleoside recognition membrane protein YjiH